jgi:hypothetical protein
MLVGGRVAAEKYDLGADIKELQVAINNHKQKVEPENNEAVSLPEPENNEAVDIFFDLIFDVERPEVQKLIMKYFNLVDKTLVQENIDELVETGIFPPLGAEISGGASHKFKKLKSKAKPHAKKLIKFTKDPSEIIRNILGASDYAALPEKLKKVDPTSSRFASLMFQAIFSNIFDVRARVLWDQGEASVQCFNTIGAVAPNCYICGTAFSETDELKPICDHVLPVAQGVFFLKLWRSGFDADQDMMLEYKWAHNCCNSIKSGKSFLKTIKSAQGVPDFVFNNENVSEILEEITSPEKACVPQAPVEIRNRVIKETIVDPILTHIYRKRGNYHAILLAGFKNCVNDENTTNLMGRLLSEYRTLKRMKPKKTPVKKTLRRIEEENPYSRAYRQNPRSAERPARAPAPVPVPVPAPESLPSLPSIPISYETSEPYQPMLTNIMSPPSSQEGFNLGGRSKKRTKRRLRLNK